MQRTEHFVFLYSELAGYFIACLKELVNQGNTATIVHWPVNPEAPFQLEEIQGITFIDRSKMSSEELIQLINDLAPAAVLCSGWIDKGYLSVVRACTRSIPRVVLLDNPWTGSFKQRIMKAISPWFIRKLFSHAWIAGGPQLTYAYKLGFKDNEVIQGLYSADVELFDKLFMRRKNNLQPFPHVFLYAGRYVHRKGITDLWSAFLEAKQDCDSDWTLRCIGTGELFDKRVEDQDIEHLGFIQPEDLEDQVVDAGVFILPSHYEPWGVAVHEYAVGGFPLILSRRIGSCSTFLKDNVNGLSFDPSEKDNLKEALVGLMSLSDDQLRSMSIESHSIGIQYSPKEWTANLISLL